MELVLSSLILGASLIVVSYIVSNTVKEITKIKHDNLAMLAKICDIINNGIKLECRVIDESGRLGGYEKSSIRTTEEKPVGDQAEKAVDIGLQPEDFMSRISKGTKTAVDFGEDVSE